MSSPARVWTVLAVLYALFFSWYTSFGGPLRPDEIEHYLEVLGGVDGDPERLALMRTFMENDTGDDFAMLNAIDFYEETQRVEGVPEGLTPSEVMSLYTEPFMGRAFRNAGHPVMGGSAASVALDRWGIEGAESWDMGALVRYRSRRDLMEQVVFMAGLEKNIHDYKIAAIRKTIAYPLDPWFQLGDPRIVLALAFLVLGLAWHLRCARAAGKPSG